MPAAADTMYIDTYDGPSEFSSTNPEFEGEEDDHHVVEGVHLVQTSPRPQCSPIIESTTTTTPKTTTTDNKFYPGDKWYGVADDGFFTGPLIAEPMDDMSIVESRECCEVLGAIALPLALAATTMGAFNLAQIEALKVELFELKENTGWLFEVIQDLTKNMHAIEESFNELRSTLMMSIILNPVLFDARLSCLENQIRHRLQ